MAYQFSDLKTKLQNQIGDPNLTDSVMTDALNYTEQSIFNTFDLTLNSEQVDLTVSQGSNTTSALPSNFQRIVNLRITSPVGASMNLKEYFMDVDAFRDTFPNIALNGSGALGNWTFFKNIEFSNKADQPYTITMDYIKSIPTMSATTDTPTIPQAFEELLILGAKIRIYEQKEDFDYASQYQNRYADLLEAFITRYSTRQVDIQGNIPGSRVRV